MDSKVKLSSTSFMFQGHYRFEGAAFPSVAELIAWQRTSGVPVTARSGALLRRAVPRENWELNNDDVQLLDKIGRVSSFMLLGLA